MSHPQLEPNLTAIPEIPKAFGEDGGHFYRHYDALADEVDEDMVKNLKSQLDSIIIFGGLFAGVNSAFLTLTLPDMRADPADDTNALLLQLVTGGNSTIRSADDLPSATFTPSPGIVPVNILFSLSLALAIIVSFFAILGQQWLVHYRQRSGGGTENQRWDQLQRYLGAKRWGLEAVVNDALPALLQLDLLMFSIASVIYLRILNKTACYVVAAPIVITVEIVIRSSECCLEDYWCPYYTMWLQIVSRISAKRYHSIEYTLATLAMVVYIPVLAIRCIKYGARIISRRIRHYFGVLLGNNSKPMQDRDHYTMLTDQDLAQRGGMVAGKGRAKPETPTNLLHAVAIQRVLYSYNDFNILIYVAINIQALNEETGIQYLLQNDTVHERLKELVSSPNKMLASAFCCAFSYLLLRGQYAELFVTQEHRWLYHSGNSLSQTSQYREGLHLLQEKVQFIRRKLDACEQSPGIGSDTLVEMRHYFGLLECLLDETSRNRDLSGWLDRIMQQQQQKELSTPLAVSLVANTVQILSEGSESAEAPFHFMLGISQSRLRSQQGEQNRQYQERVRPGQQRLEMFKRLIRTAGWDPRSYSGSRNLLSLIQKAWSAEDSESARHHTNAKIWLLEQALLHLPLKRGRDGWEFVAKTSVDLLVWFDDPEAPTPGSIGPVDSQRGNRLRCANILSQCLQDMRQHLDSFWFVLRVSPALEKLVDYWARFKDDFAQNPDLNDSEMLTTWLEIRGALDKPEESRWGRPRSKLHFGEAYPSLNAGFEAMALAKSRIETIPQVNQNTMEHPRDSALDGKAELTEPNQAVTDSTAPTSNEHFDHPLKDARESREHEDAREPNSVERNEQPVRQAGDANSKAIDEDE